MEIGRNWALVSIFLGFCFLIFLNSCVKEADATANTETCYQELSVDGLPDLTWMLQGDKSEYVSYNNNSLYKFGVPWLEKYLCSGNRKTHNGWDIHTSNFTDIVGKEVYASFDGIVKYVYHADTSGKFGMGIVIEHFDLDGTEFSTTYIHIVDPIVGENNRVCAGQHIANVMDYRPEDTDGDGILEDIDHLHFSLRKGAVASSNTPKRGALPTDQNDNICECGGNPIFPEYFVNPRDLVFVSNEIDLPTLTTLEITDITQTMATSGGNVTSDGSCSVTAKGVCWSTTPSPTIANNTTNEGAGSETYTSSLTDLNQNTTYYVRAYATNAQGTAYGNELEFTTKMVFEGDLVLATQQDVDNFGANNYSEITGYLIIGTASSGNSPSSITSLEPLSFLQVIGNDFTIRGNHSLNMLTGLNNLVSIGGRLNIDNNPLIENLDPLTSLTTVEKNVLIQNNQKLTSLLGLQNLSIIGTRLDIWNCNSLTDLRGFENISSLNGGLRIADNENLQSLIGLQNIVSVFDLDISINPSLSSLDMLSSLKTIEQTLFIQVLPKVTDLQVFEDITSLGGELQIFNNNQLSDLSGLENISFVGSNLKVLDNSVLRDLCGLQTLINNGGPSGNYQVSGNLYNPTQADIVNGDCSL